MEDFSGGSWSCNPEYGAVQIMKKGIFIGDKE